MTHRSTTLPPHERELEAWIATLSPADAIVARSLGYVRPGSGSVNLAAVERRVVHDARGGAKHRAVDLDRRPRDFPSRAGSIEPYKALWRRWSELDHERERKPGEFHRVSDDGTVDLVFRSRKAALVCLVLGHRDRGRIYGPAYVAHKLKIAPKLARELCREVRALLTPKPARTWESVSYVRPYTPPACICGCGLEAGRGSRYHNPAHKQRAYRSRQSVTR